MPVDPLLLDQALRMPASRDIRRSPIVTAIILEDARNARDLVPFLDRVETLECLNARRILARFGSDAAAHLLEALQAAGPDARKEGLEVLWTLFVTEEVAKRRRALREIGPKMAFLFADKRKLPDHMPAFIERDFKGRICDLAYILLRTLIDSEFDQSSFRAMDSDERDREIVRFNRTTSNPALT